MDNLVEVLNQAQKRYSLGVQTGSPWDGKFQTKDNKKRGRKSTLERTIKIGEILVESGRYAKLTKYFNPNPQANIMEYQRPKWPKERQITKKYADARKTKYPIFAGD